MNAPRAVDLARLGLGVTALIRPALLLRATGSEDSRGVRRTVRVLGARYVLQTGAGVVLPRTWVPDVDASVDLLHAASMIGLAAFAPRHRAIALTSAGLAVTFAVADLTDRSR